MDDEEWDDENEMFDVIEVIEVCQSDTERNDVLEKTKKDELKTEAITSKLTGACIYLRKHGSNRHSMWFPHVATSC